jgi:hypothetical protein
MWVVLPLLFEGALGRLIYKVYNRTKVITLFEHQGIIEDILKVLSNKIEDFIDYYCSRYIIMIFG